ncbi:glycosyltransferase family 2 protein [Riemerella anatipestifer]|uniref:glycosyltransferase family 2 protein n=1 Tax=Riemerella anatipestifer TaxID=34085 RepID=UPI0012AE24AA|nr:glycosyltransferase family 2 protein [Riemerella anatipestifer]MCO7319152.1 glycosyltransferase family 2 protein [Riemerella anatipestifer]MCQ4155683.1 glycosyltransferase family 2 protein [Riemerella anatipestifer]MCQ4181617.1 glycosyltransferase family 2 protein [Riemerella anatipestifer]MCW0474670.1 glycosyltransferase family 2 protein [Riemerella anatipestifer]MDR7775746.1 glycosyltransferase family 2 protein [Riemerella anatipestifer]
MINIYIKSFNRAYYLDRCLASIARNVKGTYSIAVLDDGTLPKYLDKIKEKYPQINIKTSKSYSQKIKGVEENIFLGKNIDSFNIPTDLWIETVENGTDYCIVTEDDVWFTETIDVENLLTEVEKNNINLLKLGWLSNFKDDEYLQIGKINEDINFNRPKDLFLGSKWLMDIFFYNRYKFFSITYRLGIFNNYTKRKYWSLNSILMGLWKKEYWLEVWKDAKGRVDEKQQLRNAAAYYNKHKNNPNFIARLSKEAMKTTFQSSATNSYHEYGFKVDINYINYLLNEAWYNDKLDSMQNYPNDFSTEYLETFFDDKVDKNEYRKWVEQFKNQYRNLGCSIE